MSSMRGLLAGVALFVSFCSVPPISLASDLRADPSAGGGSRHAQFLLVTSEALAPAFESYLAHKEAQGIPAELRTTEWIYANYPEGIDPPERIRNFLREEYEQGELRTVLIGGDPSVVPIRYAHSWVWNPQGGGIEIPTEWYYACLDGDWNANGNAYYGEGVSSFNPVSDQTDLQPELNVGRVPARSPQEAAIWVKKVLAFSGNQAPAASPWHFAVLGEVLFDANWEQGDCDSCGPSCPPGTPCVHLDAATWCFDVLDSVLASPAGRASRPSELYERDYWWIPRGHPNALPLGRATLRSQLDRGLTFLYHAGHADSLRWSIGADRWFPSDLLAPPAGQARAQAVGLVYSIGAFTAAIQNNCMGEAWLFAPTGGAVSYLGYSSLDFPMAEQVLSREFFHLWPGDGSTTPGSAHRGACARAGEMTGDEDGPLRFALYSQAFLGDPDLVVAGSAPGRGTALPPSVSAEESGRDAGPRAAACLLRVAGPQPAVKAASFLLEMPERDRVEVEILDVSGRTLRALLTGEVPSGPCLVRWDGRDSRGRDVAAGVYLVRARTARFGVASVRQTWIR